MLLLFRVSKLISAIETIMPVRRPLLILVSLIIIFQWINGVLVTSNWTDQKTRSTINDQRSTINDRKSRAKQKSYDVIEIYIVVLFFTYLGSLTIYF